ncbi:MAG: molybdopterin oxidoreductase, partial [Bdellovibrionales bacterium]|nr:molybdopterin oxidoreductase [Bdellovibrionales bacterium]
RNFKIDALASVKPVQTSGFELNLYETSGLRDGSLANVPWLQEFPDPVTKIVWDNYLCVSPKTASVNHLQEGEMVSLNVGEVKRKVPVHIQPGQHDDVLALAVGYGRTAAGKVANGVGVKAFDLATTVGDQIVYSGLDARFYKTKEKIMLANVQGHHSMEGRQIVVEGTLQQFKSEPDKVVHRHKIFSMWEKHKYE